MNPPPPRDHLTDRGQLLVDVGQHLERVTGRRWACDVCDGALRSDLPDGSAVFVREHDEQPGEWNVWRQAASGAGFADLPAVCVSVRPSLNTPDRVAAALAPHLATLFAANSPTELPPCVVCGRPMGWAAPSGVCSLVCHARGQGFTPAEPPEGTDPRPVVRAIPPVAGSQFDPTDPADLEQLAAHLEQRSGRAYRIPAPTEVPVNPGDPLTEWAAYPEDSAIRHHTPGGRTAIDVSFPGGDAFRIFGWTFEGDPPKARTVLRTGRFHDMGPAALAWVLARLIDRELAGDPT